jgi:hypothetical protein
MRLLPRIILTVAATVAGVVANGAADVSTTGVEALVQRRLPQHAGAFQFELVNVSTAKSRGNDTYAVSSTNDGKVLVQGNTLSALLSGYVASSLLSARVGHARTRKKMTDISWGTDCIAISRMLFMWIFGGSLAVAWMWCLLPSPIWRLL